ncbi:MAG: isochorismatase family cysteine hydrolase [Clostridia bacterium]|nr:cysteine hydrolase [Clostridia bacterium]MDH7573749.1 isochorismatase family cysteine hydrolase [Clostridia bacterium]
MAPVGRGRVPWTFRRDRSALLVIDLQNDFVAPGAIMEVPEARRQIPKVKALIEGCRRLGVPVIYTVHVHHPSLDLCPLQRRMFPRLAEEGLREGTPGVEVYPEIAPQPGELVIRKRRFSAFYNTELETVLRNLKGPSQIDTVIICGTVTNICCESTARDAFFRDYKVVFGSDVNAALDEELHRATLRNMAEVFGRVMDGQAILAALEAGEG